MAKKYKPLRDRLPKDGPIERELPSGEIIQIKSPLSYEDDTLFPLLARLENLGSEGVSGVQSIIDEMAVDPKAFRKAFKEDESLVDADLLSLFSEVGKEFGERMGTVGESKG